MVRRDILCRNSVFVSSSSFSAAKSRRACPFSLTLLPLVYLPRTFGGIISGLQLEV